MVEARRAQGDTGKPVGAVLAGGLGTRLGEPKPSADLAGRPLIEHPLRALEGAGIETFVVAKAATPLPPLAAPVWIEPDEPLHPLAGIVTALERADGRAVVVIGCDMPFVTSDLVAYLASLDGRVAVPATGGRLHPLLGRYEPDLAAALAAALRRTEPLQQTVAALEPLLIEEEALAAFGDPDRLLFNVNTPADLERARAIV